MESPRRILNNAKETVEMGEYLAKIKILIDKVEEVISESKKGVYKQKLSSDQLFYFGRTLLSIDYRYKFIKLCVEYDGLLSDETYLEAVEKKKTEIASILEDFVKYNENLTEEFGL